MTMAWSDLPSEKGHWDDSDGVTLQGTDSCNDGVVKIL